MSSLEVYFTISNVITTSKSRKLAVTMLLFLLEIGVLGYLIWPEDIVHVH